MDTIEEFVLSNKPQLDLAWQLFIYVPLVLRPNFTRHFTSSKFAGYNKLPYIPLLLHIFLGLIIVFRYQFKVITSVIPVPDIIDVSLGITNAIISWRLCKYESRGNPRIARVSFQVMGLMILLPAIMCYKTSSPVWYHAVAKMHNAFIYVRWLLIVGPALGIFDGYHELYTISVFFGGMLAAWEGNYPWDGILGVPLALVFHIGLVVIERFTSSVITLE